MQVTRNEQSPDHVTDMIERVPRDGGLSGRVGEGDAAEIEQRELSKAQILLLVRIRLPSSFALKAA